MTVKHTLTKSWTGPAGGIQKSLPATGEQEINLDFLLPAGTTNQQRPLAFKIALLQSIFISSDQNITIKTNSTSTPSDTKNITGGDPYLATGVSAPFSADVTTAYFTNAGTTGANVQVRCLTNG